MSKAMHAMVSRQPRPRGCAVGDDDDDDDDGPLYFTHPAHAAAKFHSYLQNRACIEMQKCLQGGSELPVRLRCLVGVGSTAGTG